jgi:hypothetical protein
MPKPMSKKTPKARPAKIMSPAYTDNLAVDVYILARTGLSDLAISKAIGTQPATFKIWASKYPAIAYALQRARVQSNETFQDYVYGQLPENLRDLWDRIEMWSDSDNALERIESILGKETIRVRQSLFIHAMVSANFNQSEACKKVGISYGVVQQWLRNDPSFPALLDEIEHHKKNFFEASLVQLVKEGNTLATVFVNRTKNADRGYSEKIRIEHAHSVLNTTIPLDKLKLSTECLLEIETAMEAYAAESAKPVQQEMAALPA